MPKETCLEQLRKFIAQAGLRHRSLWLGDETLEVYVRYSKRGLNGELVEALDIATITATPTGQGIGTRFITAAHELNPWPMTFVENSLNEHLTAWLERNGWLPHTTPYCYYKLK